MMHPDGMIEAGYWVQDKLAQQVHDEKVYKDEAERLFFGHNATHEMGTTSKPEIIGPKEVPHLRPAPIGDDALPSLINRPISCVPAARRLGGAIQ